jgi:hypothetical protein
MIDELLSCTVDEQINSDNFLKLSDYVWSADPDYDYVLGLMNRFPHLKLFSPRNPLDSKTGIIFCGMCQLVEDLLINMPEDGNYIIIYRDNERPFTEGYYRLKKKSVSHIYAIECQVIDDGITALPFGIASISGDNNTLEIVRNEVIEKTGEVFCRFNTNPHTSERTRAINDLKDNPLVKIILDQIGQDEFYREIKSHKFNLSLQGGGKDTTRTWETLFLGSIPIVTDCIELRHFEDMPLVYYPKEGITANWLAAQDVSGKSLTRAKMSYWENEILNKKYSL